LSSLITCREKVAYYNTISPLTRLLGQVSLLKIIDKVSSLFIYTCTATSCSLSVATLRQYCELLTVGRREEGCCHRRVQHNDCRNVKETVLVESRIPVADHGLSGKIVEVAKSHLFISQILHNLLVRTLE